MHSYLEFEKPVADLEGRIRELRSMAQQDKTVDLASEITRLEAKSQDILADLYRKIQPEPNAIARV